MWPDLDLFVLVIADANQHHVGLGRLRLFGPDRQGQYQESEHYTECARHHRLGHVDRSFRWVRGDGTSGPGVTPASRREQTRAGEPAVEGIGVNAFAFRQMSSA